MNQDVARRCRRSVLLAICCAGLTLAGDGQTAQSQLVPVAAKPAPKIALRPLQGADARANLLAGHLEVYENRAARAGRRISLYVVVQARSDAH